MGKFKDEDVAAIAGVVLKSWRFLDASSHPYSLYEGVSVLPSFRPYVRPLVRPLPSRKNRRKPPKMTN